MHWGMIRKFYPFALNFRSSYQSATMTATNLRERYNHCVVRSTPALGKKAAKELCGQTIYASRGFTRKTNSNLKKRRTRRR